MDFFLNLRKGKDNGQRKTFLLIHDTLSRSLEKRYSFYRVSDARMKCMLKVLYQRLLYTVACAFNFKLIY